MDEMRTTADIISDLLDIAKSHEWVHTYERCPRGCCGEWYTRCPSCRADEGDYDREGGAPFREHKPGCSLAKTILEAEAFMQAEEDLAELRERNAL